MSHSFLRGADMIAGALLAALGAYVTLTALQWPILGRTGPGPGFFPLGYGVLMTVVSLVLVVRAALARRPAGDDARTDWHGLAAAMTVWAAFVAAIPVMRWFGFLIALCLLFVFIVRVVYARPLRSALAAGAAAPALFYLVFTLGLQVRLPTGSLTGF